MHEKEISRSINLKIAFQGKAETNLEKILMNYDNDILLDIYYSITYKRINYNQNKMVKKIYKLLTSKDTLSNLFNKLLDNEYREIKRIIENGGKLQDDYMEIIDYSFAKSCGIVHLFNDNNKFYVVIPDEIINVINDIDFKKYKAIVDENTKINDLAYSMLNLYGFVEVGDFIDSCCKYYNYKDPNKISIKSIIWVDRVSTIRIIKECDSLYMIKEEFLDEDYIYNIKSLINRIETFDIPRKDIELEELLKYRNNYYYEPVPASKDFSNYLKKKGLTDENIKDIIETIVQTFRVSYLDLTYFISDIFSENEFILDDDNIIEIMSYVNNICSQTISWGNNGWTNIEIILEKYRDNLN